MQTIITAIQAIICLSIIFLVMIDNTRQSSRSKSSPITKVYGYKDSRSFIEKSLLFLILSLFITCTLINIIGNSSKKISKEQYIEKETSEEQV